MERNIAIIQGSSRTDGDTAFFVKNIADNCQSNIFNLKEYKIAHYDYDYGNRDADFIPLIKTLINFDLWVLASPVYWYTMSGYMKVFLDRISDLLDIEKDLGRQLRGKAMAGLSVSNEDDVPLHFYDPWNRSANYLGMEYLGEIHTYGAGQTLDIKVQQRLAHFIKLIKTKTV